MLPAGDAAPQASPGRRLTGLDGLRAISISFVLISHLHVLPQLTGCLGAFGVRIFFVISGFLITSLLLDEKRAHGRISLSAFYLRRAFRILPASYVLLGVILICDRLRLVTLEPWDLGAALTYTMNYHRQRSWYVGHLWSLSVEEQFYLLWPAVMRLGGVRGGLGFAGAMIFVAPVVRMVTMNYFPESQAGIGETFQTTFDSIACGCVLAGLRDHLAARPRYLARLASPWFVLVPLTAIAANYASYRFTRAGFAVGETVMDVAIALTVDRVTRFPVRWLDARPLVWLGGLSYSLYLWQQPFMRHSDALINRLPLSLVLALACACVSLYLVEKPFLRLRVRVDRLLRGQPRPRA